jgi:hypothetical protein
MNSVPLLQLFARLANVPSREDARGTEDYRALCIQVFTCSQQAALSGAFPVGIVYRFPAMSEEMGSLTVREYFTTLGRSQLWAWAARAAKWFSELDTEIRERLGSLEVTPV